MPKQDDTGWILRPGLATSPFLSLLSAPSSQLPKKVFASLLSNLFLSFLLLCSVYLGLVSVSCGPRPFPTGVLLGLAKGRHWQGIEKQEEGRPLLPLCVGCEAAVGGLGSPTPCLALLVALDLGMLPALGLPPLPFLTPAIKAVATPSCC